MAPGAPAFAALGLDARLVEACTALGWAAPTPIQTDVIPVAIGGRDVIALAPTGSGKTAAFALPILHRLIAGDWAKSSAAHKTGPTAAVVCPTRELALQVAKVFGGVIEQLARDAQTVPPKVVAIVGGIDPLSQAIALSRSPAIVVGTPGRLVDHLENTMGVSFASVRALVLDEADRLLGLEFEDDVATIIARTPRGKHQTLLFSATMTNNLHKLHLASLHDPASFRVIPVAATVETLDQRYTLIPELLKDCALVQIFEQVRARRAIVFVTRCVAGGRVAAMLRGLGIRAIALHGKLTQGERIRALEEFRWTPEAEAEAETTEEGPANDLGQPAILVATDVAARGLDIPAVSLVINYDLPTSSKTYLHRVGRTARAGRPGLAISIVSQYDVENFQRVERKLGYQIGEYPIDEAAARRRLHAISAAHKRGRDPEDLPRFLLDGERGRGGPKKMARRSVR